MKQLFVFSRWPLQLPKVLLPIVGLGLVCLLYACDSGKDSSAVIPLSGAGGSMARFAISGNTLYIVSKEDLNVFDITDGSTPKKSAVKKLEPGIETIFPYQNHLFIGANDGLYIFSTSNPLNPTFLSKYEHVLSCDPVVVQGKYAYVTLRASSNCRPWNGISTLDVINIENLSSPKLVSSYPLSEPYGLGVTGDKLFVCEGDNGLTLMNIANVDMFKKSSVIFLLMMLYQ